MQKKLRDIVNNTKNRDKDRNKKNLHVQGIVKNLRKYIYILIFLCQATIIYTN